MYTCDYICIYISVYCSTVFVCFHMQLVWIVVFIATVLLGAGTGLIVGIQFSLFLIVIRIIL